MKITKNCSLSLAMAAVFCSVHLHSKQGYISMESFFSRHKTLHHHWNPLNLTVEIRNRSRRVQLRIDSRFYTYNGLQTTLKKPPIYEKNKILLPLSWVNELEKKLLVHEPNSIDPKKYKVIDSRSLLSKHGSRSRKYKKADLRRSNKSSGIKSTFRGLNFIVIDPGHGGKDPGAHGHKNVLEKKITLNFSKELSKIFKKEFPYTSIIMTRNKDRFISLERRGYIANRYLKKGRFGIFLSLHFNATFSTRSNGFEIYYLDRNSANNTERMHIINKNLHSIKHRHAKKMVLSYHGCSDPARE